MLINTCRLCRHIDDRVRYVSTLSMKIFSTSGECSATMLGSSLKPSSKARTSPGDPAGMYAACLQTLRHSRRSQPLQLHCDEPATPIPLAMHSGYRITDGLPVVLATSRYNLKTSLSRIKVALTALPIGAQGTLTQIRLSRYVTCAGGSP